MCKYIQKYAFEYKKKRIKNFYVLVCESVNELSVVLRYSNADWEIYYLFSPPNFHCVSE